MKSKNLCKNPLVLNLNCQCKYRLIYFSVSKNVYSLDLSIRKGLETMTSHSNQIMTLNKYHCPLKRSRALQSLDNAIFQFQDSKYKLNLGILGLESKKAIRDHWHLVIIRSKFERASTGNEWHSSNTKMNNDGNGLKHKIYENP